MTSAASPPSLETLNDLGGTEFMKAVGPLFEDAPEYLALLASARPFDTWDTLFTQAERIALAAPVPVQVELLAAHPRIGAPPGSVSALSFLEQGYDREQAAIAELGPLNDAYEARFGFRYVIFVAGRTRSDIVPLLQEALREPLERERERGLCDVVAIARARAVALGMSAEVAG